MTNREFWESIDDIISDGFSPEGLDKLDFYAIEFYYGRLLYKRFSQAEQHGCSAGGTTHVIASILAAAGVGADKLTAPIGSFKREQQRATEQERRIEDWARKVHCWIDNVDNALSNQFGEIIAEGGEAQVYYKGCTLIKTIGLDYYIEPLLGLDRITLHNTLFPETQLSVLGFGRSCDGFFKIIVEQPFIHGSRMESSEIEEFAHKLGFSLINANNWTYATKNIYLSDLHDENVIKSNDGNVFVIDCDIRINIPELHCGGQRQYSTDIEIV